MKDVVAQRFKTLLALDSGVQAHLARANPR